MQAFANRIVEVTMLLRIFGSLAVLAVVVAPDFISIRQATGRL